MTVARTVVPLEVVAEFERAAVQLKLDPVVALKRATTELRLRIFLAAIPNKRLRPEQGRLFALKALGESVPDDLLDSVIAASQSHARRRIGLAERIELERRQLHRCALCGTMLDVAAEPHVDHRVPIAVGGGNDITNLQLLCRRCNLGKGAALHWLMVVPWQQTRITDRMRYCVLARAGGRCEMLGCDASSLVVQLSVVTRVAVARGCRKIFDNLIATCEEHRLMLLNEVAVGVRHTARAIRAHRYYHGGHQ